MYMHMFTRFCESQRRFFSLLSLKYLYISFFCLSVLCLILLLPCSSCLLHSSGACPSVPLSSACPLILLLPFVLSPSLPLSPSGAPSRLPGGLLCVVLLPSLVSYQAQNAMTVGADAPRICPRPYLLLPMCCRVSRRLFRVSVCVCVLLPVVVWWQ